MLVQAIALALHVALEQSQQGWNEGIFALVVSAPKSLLTHDPVTGLLPFQLAVAATAAVPELDTYARSSLSSLAVLLRTMDTVFRLLLACPHACSVVATGGTSESLVSY
jgi:hypothetical protein